MKTRLKRLYEDLASGHPRIGSLIRRIYYRTAVHGVKRRIRGNNNTVSYNNAVLSSVVFDIEGDDNKIEIMDDCMLNNVNFHMCGNGHRVSIGRGCRFRRGGNIWFEDSHCSLHIGDNSTFTSVDFVLTEPNSRIIIGQDCMFSYGIDARTGDAHSIISRETNERINYAEDVIIGNHVWVAAHSILLKGTVIPDDSIVATGSVVTLKWDTKGIIIGGNPAKQLRSGVTWFRRRIYKTGP